MLEKIIHIVVFRIHIPVFKTLNTYIATSVAISNQIPDRIIWILIELHR